MWRFVFLVASVASLIIAGCVGGLWVRSRSVSDHYERISIVVGQGIYRPLEVDTFVSGVWFTKSDDVPSTVTTGWHWKRTTSEAWSDPIGTPWHGAYFSNRQGFRYLVIAYWLPLVLFLLLPMVWVASHVRLRRQSKSGKCRCGYNLAGNTSGVCPECGSAIPEATGKKPSA